jgi:hypothetical protein
MFRVQLAGLYITLKAANKDAQMFKKRLLKDAKEARGLDGEAGETHQGKAEKASTGRSFIIGCESIGNRKQS